MVIHDIRTLKDAGELLWEVMPKPLRYKDQFTYATVRDGDVLERLAQKALRRGDIAIVVPIDEEASMEEYGRVLTRIRRERKELEETQMKQYIKEHPEEVKALISKWERKGIL